MTTRILIADDQEDVRIGFTLILNAQPDMTVVGAAADGTTALELARRLKPDIVLADIRMPRLDGLELTRQLAGPDVMDPTRVIVVTTFDLDDYVTTALRNGACGFLLKRSGPTLLIEAVRAAMAGDTLISPQVTVRLLRNLTAPTTTVPTTTLPAITVPASPVAATPVAARTDGADQPGSANGATTLTRRELDIARGVAEGKTNAEIAADLFISPGTVKTHISNIQGKIAARNRVGIAAWAWANGHLTP
ncbi:response regulator [Solihabitans fulvus]|uniref:response regulator n=1 Tax=Solihabitans fulvus TaxID=1892852 RepID=UPI001CB75E5F|nr:response regulator transcription factor [Solihabitans fulvus]